MIPQDRAANIMQADDLHVKMPVICRHKPTSSTSRTITTNSNSPVKIVSTSFIMEYGTIACMETTISYHSNRTITTRITSAEIILIINCISKVKYVEQGCYIYFRKCRKSVKMWLLYSSCILYPWISDKSVIVQDNSIALRNGMATNWCLATTRNNQDRT